MPLRHEFTWRCLGRKRRSHQELRQRPTRRFTLPWNSRFSSLLEFAEACDVPVKWACRTGVCHTCECALIGGTVQYEPDPLEPPATGNVLICCSRPSGDVEVDL